MPSLYIYNGVFATLVILTPFIAWVIVRLAKMRRAKHSTVDVTTHIIREAHKQAAQIIQEASTKAQQLIRDIQVIKEHTEQTIQLHLTEAMKHASSESKRALEQLHMQTQQELAENVQYVKAALAKHIANLTSRLEQRSAEIEQALSEQARSEQARLRLEQTHVKEQVRQEYEKYLQAQLPSIIKSVTGRALTTHDHEQLIRDALRNAEFELLPRKTAYEPPSTQQTPTSS